MARDESEPKVEGLATETPATTTALSVPPVFMFGFERSGTTMLSMMMGAHPDLAVPFSATGLWYRYADRLETYGALAAANDVERMVDELLREERIGLWDAELDRNAILDGLELGSYAAVVARFHAAYAAAKGKPHWGNIDIATLYHMDQVNRWFPDARFIHIVRDCRDVALSHKTYAYGASNVLECAELWKHDIHANLMAGSMLDEHRYLVVRYEDLVLDCENTLRRLCRFAGLAFAPEMMAYHETVSERIPESRRWLWPDITRAPVAGNVYRWRNTMPAADQAIVSGVAGELLDQFGYEPTGKAKKSLWPFLKELWYFAGRGHRFNRLLVKFGLRSRRNRRK